MAQHLMVGLIVFAAALYSLWMLMPAAVRRSAAARLASLARRCGLGEQQTRRLEATLTTHSSCGECASCKGCATRVAEKVAVVMPLPAGSGRTGEPRSK